MAQINFESNELFCFYQLWLRGLGVRKDTYDKILKSFPLSLEQLPITYPDLKNLSPTDFKKYLLIEQDIVSKKITTVNQLATALNIEKSDIFEKAFKSYQNFYKANSSIIEANKNEMHSAYLNEGLNFRLGQISHFLWASTTKKITVYLHPYPCTPIVDGWCSQIAANQTFNIHKNPHENYVGASTIFQRKLDTPLHEATHVLFVESQLLRNIKKGDNPTLNKFLSIIKNNLKRYDPDTPRSEVDALNEALAATLASAFVAKKQDDAFDPTTSTLYYGFTTADKLAHCLLPAIDKYIKSRKQIDDAFFKEVMDSEIFKKYFADKGPDLLTNTTIPRNSGR